MREKGLRDSQWVSAAVLRSCHFKSQILWSAREVGYGNAAINRNAAWVVTGKSCASRSTPN
jgi:hypothetical protein